MSNVTPINGDENAVGENPPYGFGQASVDLWGAVQIIELARNACSDDNDAPPVRSALRAAANIITATINKLDEAELQKG